MANQEHLDILKQGVDVWNEWREEHPEIEPDLSRTDSKIGPLAGFNFSGANLSRTDLRNVIIGHLSHVNLSHTNLRNASLLTSLHEVDLSGADLNGANLSGTSFANVDFRDANLSNSNLSGTDLNHANLKGVNFSGANFTEAHLLGCDLTRANLSHTDLRRASFSTNVINDIDYDKLDAQDMEDMKYSEANLQGANLEEADLREVNLSHVNLSQACLRKAKLQGANLQYTNLNGTDLSGVDLTGALLVRADLTNANLTGCRIYGISAWDVILEGAIQKDLIITPLEEILLPNPALYPSPILYPGKSEITVDNLEVAQFIYLLLNNQKIRDIIDTITSKMVLILGRFTKRRKPVLDALRNELRNYNFTPVVFDFDPSANRDLTETISLLARMSRFIIADITEAKSIAQELESIVPHLPSVPVQPILHKGAKEYAMFEHYERYPWVLPVYHYQDIPSLLASIKEDIIEPIEQKEHKREKAEKLEEKLRMLEQKIRELEGHK